MLLSAAISGQRLHLTTRGSVRISKQGALAGESKQGTVIDHIRATNLLPEIAGDTTIRVTGSKVVRLKKCQMERSKSPQ